MRHILTILCILGIFTAACLADSSVSAQVRQHAKDTKNLFQVIFRLTPKEFSDFIFPLIKEKQAILKKNSKFDVSSYFKNLGIHFKRGMNAIADSKSKTLSFINSGEGIDLICTLLDPVLYPDSFYLLSPAEQGAAANP